jgi:hypothetical protein
MTSKLDAVQDILSVGLCYKTASIDIAQLSEVPANFARAIAWLGRPPYRSKPEGAERRAGWLMFRRRM